MNEAILEKLFKLYKTKKIPNNKMSMTIPWLGNNSVTTLPTMFDLLLRGKLDNQKIHSVDIVIFASTGAGMNINSMFYKI